MMNITTVSYGVTYHDPDRMNQQDVTRYFGSKQALDVFVAEDLEKISPNARNIEKFRITTKRESLDAN